MARVLVGMTMSLDGFVADASGSADLLYTDLAALHGTEYMNTLVEQTGAVLMGRRAFEMGEGFKLGPNTTVWATPGHTPQDASLVVDTAEGRHAFTHLWWRSDRTPEVDPYSTDLAELARNRQRLLDSVDVVIPGHGAPFRVR